MPAVFRPIESEDLEGAERIDDEQWAVDEVAPPTVERVETVLNEIEAALRRLDDGSYGRCLTCGAEVEDDRLAREPTTGYCSACAPLPPGQSALALEV